MKEKWREDKIKNKYKGKKIMADCITFAEVLHTKEIQNEQVCFFFISRINSSL